MGQQPWPIAEHAKWLADAALREAISTQVNDRQAREPPATVAVKQPKQVAGVLDATKHQVSRIVLDQVGGNDAETPAMAASREDESRETEAKDASSTESGTCPRMSLAGSSVPCNERMSSLKSIADAGPMHCSPDARERTPSTHMAEHLDGVPSVAVHASLPWNHGSALKPVTEVSLKMPGSLWIHKARPGRQRSEQSRASGNVPVQGRSAGVSVPPVVTSDRVSSLDLEAARMAPKEKTASLSPSHNGPHERADHSPESWTEVNMPPADKHLDELNGSGSPEQLGTQGFPLPPDQHNCFLKRGAAVMSCFDLPLLTNHRRRACNLTLSCANTTLGCPTVDLQAETSLEQSAACRRRHPDRLMEQLHALALSEGLVEQGEPPTPVDPADFGFGALVQASSYLLSPKRPACNTQGGHQVEAEYTHIWMAPDGQADFADACDAEHESTAEHNLLACIETSAHREELEFRKLAHKVLDKVRVEVEVCHTPMNVLNYKIRSKGVVPVTARINFVGSTNLGTALSHCMKASISI
jgi:hypothetical protein